MLVALFLLTALQQKSPFPDAGTGTYRVELSPKDIPAQGKRPPVLLIEGTTTCPHGSRFDVDLFFDKKRDGRQLASKAIQALDGKFALELPLFESRNLAGVYIIELWFHPDLQHPDVRAQMGTEAVTKLLVHNFRIGDEKQAKAEKRAHHERLADDVRAFQAIADEIAARAGRPPRKPDRQPDREAWGKLTKTWEERAFQIESRGLKVQEYRALGLDEMINNDFEKLREDVSVICRRAFNAANNPKDPGMVILLQEIRTAYKRSGDKLIEELVGTQASREQVVATLAEIRTLLRGALELAGDALPASRLRFRKAAASLESPIFEKRHDSIVAVVTRGLEFYAARAEGKPEAAAIHKELEAEIEKLSRYARGEK